jgi:hypothetical protein
MKAHPEKYPLFKIILLLCCGTFLLIFEGKSLLGGGLPEEQGSTYTRRLLSDDRNGGESRHLSGSLFTDTQTMRNADTVHQNRKVYKEHCVRRDTTKENVVDLLKDWYTPPAADSADSDLADELPIEPCKFTFLDFGANVGDSLGKLIDTGIDSCLEKEIVAPRFDIVHSGTIRQVRPRGARINKLTRWARQVMDATSAQISRQNDPLQPEDYCYYGVEGNPVFTKRLKSLEEGIMRTDPRPVRSAHFFTETIGAGEDGTSVLYLDTINNRENFWGSSIYASHWDVKASAEKQQATFGKIESEVVKPIEAPVTAVTLTTLLPQVALKKAGSHVIIKCDIEGAEYLLFNEAFDSGILCDYVDAAVRLDILIETHGEVSRLVDVVNKCRGK